MVVAVRLHGSLMVTQRKHLVNLSARVAVFARALSMPVASHDLAALGGKGSSSDAACVARACAVRGRPHRDVGRCRDRVGCCHDGAIRRSGAGCRGGPPLHFVSGVESSHFFCT